MPEDTKPEYTETKDTVAGEPGAKKPENEPAPGERVAEGEAAEEVTAGGDSDTAVDITAGKGSDTDAAGETAGDAVKSDEKPVEAAKEQEKPAARPSGRRQYSAGRGRTDTQRSGQNNGPRQRRGYFRKKVCRLCVNKIKTVDYKDVDLLKRFVTERGKILPRRMTGTCAKHQRVLSAAVKRARMVALLPFVKK